LPSTQKIHASGRIAAGGSINISIGTALTIVRSMMAADRFDLRTGP
jgi:hypothetical protein